MSKFIRIMAIVAAALESLTLLLILVSTLFQQSLAVYFFNYPDEVVGLLPMFPILPCLYSFARLGVMALFIICCGNKKGGIWLEIVLFFLLTMVIPVAFNALSVYSVTLTNIYGDSYLIAQSIVSTIINYVSFPSMLSIPLAYLTCGMSIAYKLKK